jgi:hypothetical protein
MNSAAKAGHIFAQAGEAYSRLGDMIMSLHPAAAELRALDKKQVLAYIFIIEN